MNSLASRWIPQSHLDSLRATHAEGVATIARYGVPPERIEPVEVAEAVESHRWSWKPERPKLVVLAESHVFTTLTELARTYTNPSGAELAPSNYVRLVYCLGYGEASLCPGLKGGTPQYWSIFGSLVGTSPKHSYGAVSRARLDEKVRTLQLMQQLGVWLLDASLHGIYMPKGERIDFAQRQLTADLQHLWLSGYGGKLLEEAKPERIVAIGKGLYDNLNGSVHFADWIYQPQGARTLSQMARNRDVLAGLHGWLLQGGPL